MRTGIRVGTRGEEGRKENESKEGDSWAGVPLGSGPASFCMALSHSLLLLLHAAAVATMEEVEEKGMRGAKALDTHWRRGPLT